MPPLNESNQEPVSEKGHFSAVDRLNILFARSRQIRNDKRAWLRESSWAAYSRYADLSTYLGRLPFADDALATAPRTRDPSD